MRVSFMRATFMRERILTTMFLYVNIKCIVELSLQFSNNHSNEYCEVFEFEFNSSMIKI